MKIVCESCGTKYSIADEKVSGKVFKLRCKKCSHVIVVKGNGESEAAAQETPAPAAAPAPEPEPAAPAGSPDAVWHLVIDREQVGPMTAEEVRAKFAAGQVDAESYVWREGFDDWLKLATVDIFSDLASAPAPARGNGEDQATRRSDTADIFRQNSAEEEPSPAADLFGAGAAAPASSGGVTASPNAATMMASGPVVAPFAASTSGRSSSSSGPAVEASPGGGSVEVKSMTGARSENSVLFSLNNLQALATGGGPGGGAPTPSAGPKPGYASSQSEGSGLIDIRAMAAQTLSANSFSVGTASKPDELPMVNEAPLFSPVAPAVLMPISEPTGMPKWVWAVVGVGGAALLGMIAVIVWVLRAPPPPAQPTTQPSPSGSVASSGGTNPESPKTTPPSGQPAAPVAAAPAGDNGSKAQPKDDAASDADKKRRPKDKGDKPDKGDKAPKGAAPKEAAPAPAPTPPPAAEPPKKAKPNKPKDDLDDLLDSATGGSGSGKPKGESAKKDAPEQLSMDVIKSGLKSVQGSVNGCGAGTYSVKLTIGRNGRVNDASVPGKAGDSAADCVVRAVKGARFPEFTGDPQTLTYPFIVR